MRHIAGTIAGLLSGFLIYMMFAMVFMDFSNPENSSKWIMMFFIGWIGTHFFVVKGTKGFSKPMARAFLIGATEWLVMIAVGTIFAGKTVARTVASSDAERVGASLGGGLFAFLSGTLSLVMAVFCLVGFAIFYFINKSGKETMGSDKGMKKCPDCAELILTEANKCKHCSHSFLADTKEAI